jgi:lysyl-tRNA synthetase class 2
LIKSLENMPDCAGVAMGIDRLMMALLDSETLADVLAFDFSKA